MVMMDHSADFVLYSLTIKRQMIVSSVFFVKHFISVCKSTSNMCYIALLYNKITRRKKSENLIIIVTLHLYVIDFFIIFKKVAH
jgi:hypothetical protein